MKSQVILSHWQKNHFFKYQAMRLPCKMHSLDGLSNLIVQGMGEYHQLTIMCVALCEFPALNPAELSTDNDQAL